MNIKGSVIQVKSDNAIKTKLRRHMAPEIARRYQLKLSNRSTVDNRQRNTGYVRKLRSLDTKGIDNFFVVSKLNTAAVSFSISPKIRIRSFHWICNIKPLKHC